MKKVVIFLITIFFVVSVVVVGIYGVKMEADEIIYIEEIRINNVIFGTDALEVDKLEGKNQYRCSKILFEDTTQFYISYDVLPDNASSHNVVFSLSNEDYVTIDKKGVVSYKGPYEDNPHYISYNIMILADDGHSASANLKIISTNKAWGNE